MERRGVEGEDQKLNALLFAPAVRFMVWGLGFMVKLYAHARLGGGSSEAVPAGAVV